MRVRFTKMHGLGNDFVVLDAREGPLPPVDAALARALCNRHEGIGCDQLIVVSGSASADVAMRIFNPDGSEVAACGNATRAVALREGGPVRIETGAGILSALPGDEGIAVEMGRPAFAWQEIPLAFAMDTLVMPLAWGALAGPSAVNVGNPHLVFFVADCDAVPLETLGPEIEHDPLFPERINVNVDTVLARSALELRVWERGAGLTLACGTGACASAVAAMRRGLVDRAVTVTLPGGSLHIEWRRDDMMVMKGPAVESFRGSFEASALLARHGRAA